MTTRANVQKLLDDLPDDLLPVAEDSMRRIIASADDAFWKRLDAAPVDDEPLSDREIEALRRFDAGERKPRFFTEQELEEFWPEFVTDFIAWDAEALEQLLDLMKTDSAQARRIFRAVYRSRAEPGADIRKLEGRQNRWRLRVGEWRVIYGRTSFGLQILEVVDRRDAYR